MEFRHTPDMGEISGFGGGYEQCCQDMLEAGVKWLEANRGRDLDFQGKEFKNIYGICEIEGDDGKALEKAVLAAAHDEATGAMHHTVMQRLFFISKNGWDKYCAELREHEQSVDRTNAGPDATEA